MDKCWKSWPPKSGKPKAGSRRERKDAEKDNEKKPWVSTCAGKLGESKGVDGKWLPPSPFFNAFLVFAVLRVFAFSA